MQRSSDSLPMALPSGAATKAGRRLRRTDPHSSSWTTAPAGVSREVRPSARPWYLSLRVLGPIALIALTLGFGAAAGCRPGDEAPRTLVLLTIDTLRRD